MSDGRGIRGAPTSTASPEIQELARRLIAFETSYDNSSAAPAEVMVGVIDELRMPLTRLAGVDGFRSLLSRALTLAKSEVPSLNMVHVGPDGSLEGLEGIEQSQAAGAVGQAGIALVSHLLELLVTFIGQPLTLRLVRDKWPDASIEGADLRELRKNNERAKQGEY